MPRSNANRRQQDRERHRRRVQARIAARRCTRCGRSLPWTADAPARLADESAGWPTGVGRKYAAPPASSGCATQNPVPPNTPAPGNASTTARPRGYALSAVTPAPSPASRSACPAVGDAGPRNGPDTGKPSVRGSSTEVNDPTPDGRRPASDPASAATPDAMPRYASAAAGGLPWTAGPAASNA